VGGHPRSPSSSNQPPSLLDHVRELALAIPGVTEGEHGGVPCFVLTEGQVLCVVHDPAPDGRSSLWCPAPHGVPNEMVDAEPGRFFHPPSPPDAATAGWLGVRLDGTDHEAVDWDEVAAILDEACLVAGSPAGADRPGSDVAASRRGDDGSFHFRAELWLHSGEVAWYFITLPTDIAAAIDDESIAPRRGFGSIRVDVTIGSSRWSTSIFPDSERGSYLLPVKKAVRTKQKLDHGDAADVMLTLSG